MKDAVEQITKAMRDDDAAAVRQCLEAHPEWKAHIDDPVGPFDSPAVTCARSREMLDVLIAAGADINAKSRWWAGGFGLLHTADPELAAYAIERGAVVDVHAAARLNRMERLRELISTNATLVNARGGDGQTPLHFASTVEIAAYLLDQGADIEARDVDHESTSAQYMVRDRQPVLRYLIQRRCQTDILMTAALGDADLVGKHLDNDPDSIRLRVSDEHFPMIDPKSGGTIYQWMLGWHVSAHDVANQFGHEEVFQLLMERSPADVKLIAACGLGDEATATALLAQHPNLAGTLREADRRQVAQAARNNNLTAVRLMLASGWPVDALGQHGATPLHWAAFHGNAEMARVILGYHPSLEKTDASFNGTPLGWAIHGSEHGWYSKSGSYAATAELLLEVGAKSPEKIAGTGAVKEILRRYGVKE
ncbi:MAG TPA: ankyrin repeat domain-containing protein [Methylomirabilota bacterium]|nr:ankyrin repeat domain-containing protein [Methylomirabilota bacterium]